MQLLLVVIFLCAGFGLAAPPFSDRSLPKRQNDLTTGAEPRSSYSLPPVDDVFKFLSDSATINSGAEAVSPPQILWSSQAIVSSTAVPPSLPEPTTSLTAIHPTNSSSKSGVELKTVQDEEIPSISSSETASSNSPPPVGKLVVIAAVMAGIIGLIICAYFILDWPILAACRKSRKKASMDKLDKLAYGEKKTIGSPQGTLLSKVSDGSGETDLKPYSREERENNRSSDIQVIDISLPQILSTPSEWRSISSLPGQPLPEPMDVHPSTVPLLPPHEFFRLSSGIDNSRHSRAHSIPLFGHHPIRNHLEKNRKRAGEHRKSKSISGLVYIVGTAPLADAQGSKF